MRLTRRHNLLFVAVTVTHRGLTARIDDVLIDTGSASTLMNADLVASAGIFAMGGGHINNLQGIGGFESVFTHVVDRIDVDGHGLAAFTIEVGEVNYGFDIGGILGMDFLLAAAVPDLRNCTLRFH